ncbi:MAG TPA: hypothetical protein ENI83_02250 [Gammaproteobacteria bacterium]|nr:hypothetical protein [Gammaproteobacteria bacterium]
MFNSTQGRKLKQLASILSLMLLNACGGGGGSGGPGSEADSDAPTAAILYPPAMSLTEGDSITVRGTASDASEITVLRVNGVDAVSDDGYATWTATVPLAPGMNKLSVETGDIALNGADNVDEVIIEAGPLLSKPRSPVLDSVNNRVFLLDSWRRVVSVDLKNGARTIVSDESTPDSVNVLRRPVDMVLDGANQRLLVVDMFSRSVLAVDLTTGARTVVSDATTTVVSDATTDEGINAFESPVALALDNQSEILYVSDNGLNAVLSVDLNSGARKVLSDSPDNGNSIFSPGDLVLDSTNKRLLVLDFYQSYQKDVVSIDLATGVRTILSGNGQPDTENEFSSPAALALDELNSQLFVADPGLPAVVAVDLETGRRTILSDNDAPDNARNALQKPVGLALDRRNNRLLLTDQGLDALLAVDMRSGSRTILSDGRLPDANNGLGSPNDVLIDRANRRLLVADSVLDAVVAVDLETGARTIISDSNTPDNTNALASPASMALDSVNNRLWVADTTLDAVVEVDLSTGSRTVISSNDTPVDAPPLELPRSIVYDEPRSRLLVLDSSAKAVMSVDINTGARTILSDNNTADAANAFDFPRSMVLDEANNRVLVTDQGAIIAVDLNSGARSIAADSAVTGLDSPQDIVLDGTAADQVLVLDDSLQAVLAINLRNGTRRIVSDPDSPGVNNTLNNPQAMALDTVNNQLFVTDEDGFIVALDRTNGQWVYFSR